MRAGSICRRLVGVAMAAGMVGSAMGCGSGLDPVAEADGAASIATTHGGSTGDELILPVDAYGFTVPERNKLGLARDILIGECMRGFGFAYDAIADAAQYRRLTRANTQDFGFYGNKRRYSVTNMATAATYGYHLVSAVTDGTSPGNQANAHGLGSLSTAGEAVLVGLGPDGRPVSKSASGRRVPAGGCVGAADATLARSGSVGEAKPVSDLAARSYEQSLKDATVTAAFKKWSTCMAGRGYHYASPLDKTGFNIDVKTVSTRETATARADVACKQQTHLVDTWFHAEVGYQKAWIEQHADQFLKAKSDHYAVMKVVSKILSSSH